jgi:hypothetical protein
MSLLLRTGTFCFLFLFLAGCGPSNSVPSKHERPTVTSESDAREEARKVILDYIDRYEEIYLQLEGPEMETRLSELTSEYHKRLFKLTEEGKWTPSKEMGTSITLSFLIGQFQGGLQSCKVERAHKDKALVGCDQVKKLRDAIEQLCSK